MAKDRDDKFEEHEESEYHFSDEEASYEVEPETSKQGRSGAARESLLSLSRLTASRRMLISLGVFLLLVFVVYKMVSPTSSVPSTDITPPVAANTAMPQSSATTTAVQSSQAVPPAPASPGSVAALNNVPPPTAAQAPAAPVAQQAQPVAAPAPPGVAQLPAVAQAPAVVQQMLSQATAVPTVGPQQGPAIPSQQPVVIVPAQAPVSGMPAVIPVQSPTPTYPGQPAGTIVTGSVEEKAAIQSAEGARLMTQLQGQVNEQMTVYSNQNKALQTQMESLSARVSAMENQLGQLIQALTKRNQGSTMNNQPGTPSTPIPAQAVMPKVAYNVQAIIPGRAWLKSENGETLTVTEGDIIKDVGRVARIDPYDGVVEIHTGTKSISLSYGG